MDVLALPDAPAAPSNAPLAALVMLAACILSLEILQRLLAARALAALAMASAWIVLLSPPVQLRAVLYAVIAHTASEGAGQWRAGFPVLFSRNRDRCAMLWLLFWLRVFVWGATLGALSALNRRPTAAQPASWTSVVGITGYYEMVEVLLLLFFSTEPFPYQLARRVVNWAAVLSLCCFERSASWMPWVMDTSVMTHLSPVSFAGMCFVVMCASMVIPWNEVARRAAPELQPRKSPTFLGREDGFGPKKHLAYAFRYAHEEGSSEDTAQDTASDEEDDRR